MEAPLVLVMAGSGFAGGCWATHTDSVRMVMAATATAVNVLVIDRLPPERYERISFIIARGSQKMHVHG
jgi:hypothetical protein